MDIRGMSSATLELLISHGFIHNFKDIYHLSDVSGQLMHLDGLGKKSVEKLLKSIEDSRNVKLENFIAALGIPNIGLTAAKTIANYCSGRFSNGGFAKFIESVAAEFDFTKLDDFGAIMNNSIYNYMRENFSMVEELAKEMNFIEQVERDVVQNPFIGKTICVTGKLNHFTRDSINEKIISLGAKTAGSVSKKTDYLVTNEASGSSKYKKAVELNVPIITEEEFLHMIGE
jgi:DNA ligase (NAD+)